MLRAASNSIWKLATNALKNLLIRTEKGKILHLIVEGGCTSKSPPTLA
jgi:hypothetical protein